MCIAEQPEEAVEDEARDSDPAASDGQVSLPVLFACGLYIFYAHPQTERTNTIPFNAI